MKKYLPILASACFAIGMPSAFAETTTKKAPVKTAPKASPKAASKARATAKASARATPPIVEKMPFSSDAEDDENEPEIGDTKSSEFTCEMGNKLTIYANEEDDKHIAIRWNKRISRLTRVATTTGAHRFENRKTGLVWIGIPAKGILLDSRRGKQLANECNHLPAPATSEQ